MHTNFFLFMVLNDQQYAYKLFLIYGVEWPMYIKSL